jgi:hypothetical protein
VRAGATLHARTIEHVRATLAQSNAPFWPLSCFGGVAALLG